MSHPSPQDPLAALASAGGFTTFLALAAQSGLATRLGGAGPFTLFAPVDEAFARFPASALDKLRRPDQHELLKAVVTAHLVAGKVLTQRLAGRRIRGKSVQGGELVINGARSITINGATVVRSDIIAANGVIHGIDKVLWPTLAREDERAVGE